MTLHTIAVGLAVVAGALGFYASFKWYQASTYDVARSWGASDHVWRPAAMQDAMTLTRVSSNVDRSSQINKEAAFWTGVSVLLNAASAVAGALA